MHDHPYHSIREESNFLQTIKSHAFVPPLSAFHFVIKSKIRLNSDSGRSNTKNTDRSSSLGSRTKKEENLSKGWFGSQEGVVICPIPCTNNVRDGELEVGTAAEQKELDDIREAW